MHACMHAMCVHRGCWAWTGDGCRCFLSNQGLARARLYARACALTPTTRRRPPCPGLLLHLPLTPSRSLSAYIQEAVDKCPEASHLLAEEMVHRVLPALAWLHEERVRAWTQEFRVYVLTHCGGVARSVVREGGVCTAGIWVRCHKQCARHTGTISPATQTRRPWRTLSPPHSLACARLIPSTNTDALITRGWPTLTSSQTRSASRAIPRLGSWRCGSLTLSQ